MLSLTCYTFWHLALPKDKNQGQLQQRVENLDLVK